MDSSTKTDSALAYQQFILGSAQRPGEFLRAEERPPPTATVIKVNVGQLSIVCNGRALLTRSRALVVFVCCLVRHKRAQPNAPWIGIDALRTILPSVHGKQMQRFVDALATIQFPISYESKTRGRYCLNVAAERVRFDVDALALDEFINAPGNGHLASARQETVEVASSIEPRLRLTSGGDDLLGALVKINRADAQFHDGNLDSGNDHAYELWRRLIETAEPEIKATALLKFARVCRRLQRYGEAQEALRKLRQMVHKGEIACGTLEYKGQLCLSMLRYEQGRGDEARAIVDKLDMQSCVDDAALGEYYNLMGLLACHAMRVRHQAALENRSPPPDELPALLGIAARHYRQALILTARTNDYQSLQRVCFNFGNLHIRAYQFKYPMPERELLLIQGINWIAQCEFICSKFGVGMDSLWSRIVLLKAALEGGLDLNDLDSLCGGMFKQHFDLESLALATLRETVRVGNRIEQGSTLEILAEIARRKGDALGLADFRLQALVIYRKLNRADLTRRLNRDFAQQADVPSGTL